MRAITGPLSELADFEEIARQKMSAPGMIRISGCINSQKSHMVHALSDGCFYKVIVSSGETKARQIYEELKGLEENTLLYPAKDFLFYQADIRSRELTRARMTVLQSMIKDQTATVVTSFDALMDHLLPKEKISSQMIEIDMDSIVDPVELGYKLAMMGYSREVQIEGPGQFAVRGEIIDVFPLTEEQPVRIELFDVEVDQIKTFDLESQRSIENLDRILIPPAVEYPQNGERGVSFLEYFPKDKTLVFIDEPVRVMEKGQAIEDEFYEAQKRRLEAGYQMEDGETLIFATREIADKLNKYSSIGFLSLDIRSKELLSRASYSVHAQSVGSYNGSFDMLVNDLKKYKKNGSRVILVSGSRSRAKRLAEDLREDYGLSSFYSEEQDRLVLPGEIMTVYGYVAEGYEYPMLKFTILSESDIFGKKKTKKKRKKYEGRRIQDFAQLKPGDYVVHENHGLGIYQGIEKIEVDKITKDYMKISYANNGNLYIPATQLDLIQKYANADAKAPKLNKLGTQEWNRTKTKVKGAVREIAKDLVALYATRQQTEGFQYGPDTIWQTEFEEMFPFEETEDQTYAIEAVKRDMESPKIMDRLICGDVGFGKTEVAIRAAFKAVQESKQVVYLVPTTILAQQHYNTFVQRMKDFPVQIELLCRFRTPSQQKKTIENVKKGQVDIVIGTHRVLSKDVEFKDLGLLIIDEEQRFGVQHKETIKKMKENVDVLTLTATPIPRTLHMSLIGIRDMSVLEEAPNDRMPIQTYVMEQNDEMIREAIQRELSRDGQVYYVYNKVDDIEEVTQKIRRLCPDAVVEYAHGQMKETVLERIMFDFLNGEIDVLVSTTIIETGLDISNVNTMIIQDADKFGLSQLYQLRGRVGRSNRMAYAFLFYRRDKMLKEVAEKRLAAIRQFTDLGSGFKIAMRDLEIRGAGNLLGAQQHGHMQAVGYDLYCKMLNEAVKLLKGEIQEDSFTTTMDINVDAFIPDTYIPNEYQKLDIYKRIAAIENVSEKDDMLDELTDRFGDPPKKVEKLLEVAVVKAKAHSLYMTAVEQKGGKYIFTMYEKAKINVNRVPEILQASGGELRIDTKSETPCFIYEKKQRNKKSKPEDSLEIVKSVLNLFQPLIDG